MAYKEISGNIFNTKAMAIVNTVNCMGAMGKGLALDFKLRFPDMFREYQSVCLKRLLKPGQILPYRKSTPIILNFAIKDDWKKDAKIEWIETTLQKFVANYQKMEIMSVAFPWMGAMNGGLPIEKIKNVTRKYLSNLEDIDIEVYDFNPDTPCDLYRSLRNIIASKQLDVCELERLSHIQSRYWLRIIDAVHDPNTKSMNNLWHYTMQGKRIIGKTNLERLFLFLTLYKDNKLPLVKTLF